MKKLLYGLQLKVVLAKWTKLLPDGEAQPLRLRSRNAPDPTEGERCATFARAAPKLPVWRERYVNAWYLGPGAHFSKVPKLFGAFSGVTVPFVSQERRAFLNA